MTVRELPRVEYEGKTYFWDERLDQLRNVDDPNDYIDHPTIRYRHEATEENGVRRVTFTPYVFSPPNTQKFKLEITLGNDAMQTEGDIANALRHICDVLEVNDEAHPEAYELQVFDINGNAVGKFGFYG